LHQGAEKIWKNDSNVKSGCKGDIKKGSRFVSILSIVGLFIGLQNDQWLTRWPTKLLMIIV